MKKSTVILVGHLCSRWAQLSHIRFRCFRKRGRRRLEPQLARRIGAIKTIQGNALTLTADSGADVAVTVQPNARILRIAPGAKDLKDATPVQLQDLQVGDRVRVRGQAGSDQNQIAALEVIVMARTDLDARRRAGAAGLAEARYGRTG